MKSTLKHQLLKRALVLGAFIGLPIVLTSCFDSKPAKEKEQRSLVSSTDQSPWPKTVADVLAETKNQNGQALTELKEEQLYRIVKNGVVMVDAKVLATSERSSAWCGTGFIVDLSKGLIVTNAHVAGEFKSVCTFEVTFGDGTQAEAKLQYIDPCYDLAVLKVSPDKVPTDCIQLELCSEELKDNTKVFAMGNSWKNSFSTYQGVVFDTFSVVGLHEFPEQSFQFSGLTVGGASGSPVFRSDGKVVGIIYGGEFISGAALPASYIRYVVDKVKNDQPIKRFSLEAKMDYKPIQEFVEAGALPEDFAKTYNEKFPEAKRKIIYVTKAFVDSSSNGFRGGDILVSIEDQNIGCHLSRVEEIVQKMQGNKLKVCVYRDGQRKVITVYPKAVKGLENFSMVHFDGAVFQEEKQGIMGSKRGVHISSSYDSPFKCVEGVVKSIDNVEIKTLDDVFNVIPKLYEKKWFKIRLVSEGAKSTKEEIHWIKHNPKFIEEARYYIYNSKKGDFDVRRFANPSK